MGLLTVDPGLRGCGVALFRDGRLVWAKYVLNLERTDRGGDCFRGMAFAVENEARHAGYEGSERVLVELPQVYQSKHQKGDQDDILQLAGVVGALCMALPPSRTVRPREWKGTIAKEVMTRRILSRLDTDEDAAILRKSEALDHNIIDAVGIGLWYLGRLNGSSDQ